MTKYILTDAKPQVRPDFIEPPNVPKYALIAEGDCLAPTFQNGALVVIEDCLPDVGDIAVIYFKDGRQPIMKYLVWPLINFPPSLHEHANLGMASIRVKQINPEILYHIKPDDVAAIHTVTGECDKAGNFIPLEGIEAGNNQAQMQGAA